MKKLISVFMAYAIIVLVSGVAYAQDSLTYQTVFNMKLDMAIDRTSAAILIMEYLMEFQKVVGFN